MILFSFATSGSSVGDAEDDEDDVSRLENRSVDVLVDEDGGTQLIAYSVFEQVRFSLQLFSSSIVGAFVIYLAFGVAAP